MNTFAVFIFLGPFRIRKHGYLAVIHVFPKHAYSTGHSTVRFSLSILFGIVCFSGRGCGGRLCLSNKSHTEKSKEEESTGWIVLQRALGRWKGADGSTGKMASELMR